ncbi:MAG: disulfide bond formation protein B [Caldimonas sp.]
MTRSRPARGGAATTLSFALVALVSFGAVTLALISQHVYEMQPCAWCVLQRLIFVAIGVFALLGLVWRGAAGSRVAGTFALLLATAGIAAAFWHKFVAAKSASCNLTLADRIVGATRLDTLLPDVFETRASCADAAVNVLGVPYPMWAALAFALCAIVLVRILRTSA